MNREEFTSDLGKYLYDYSEIRKQEIPREVLEDISSSFFTRQEVEDYEVYFEHDMILFIVLMHPSLRILSLWKEAFGSHGYNAPLIEFK